MSKDEEKWKDRREKSKRVLVHIAEDFCINSGSMCKLNSLVLAVHVCSCWG